MAEPVAPTLRGTLTATMDEGGTVTLKPSNLFYNDPDSQAADIHFSVSNIAPELTILLNGEAVSEGGEFTYSDIVAGRVTFEHNGDETTSATFDVTVIDESAGSDTKPFVVTVNPVNDAPTLDLPGSAPSVVEGDPTGYLLSAADFYYTDVDDDVSGVTFTISNLQHGAVMVDGVVASSFTAEQMDAGLVYFVQNGDEDATAGFTVSVDDGNEDGSTPQGGSFEFSVEPVNDLATLSGTLKGTVREIFSTSASGTLKVTDPDNSPAFDPLTNVASDLGYGVFSIDANGKWTYKLTAKSGDLGLDTGDKLQDTVTFTSADGETEIQVTVDIQGTTDLNGTNGNDKGSTELQGTAKQDYMHGLKGSDVVFGSRGDDFLFGDAGNDQLHGDDAKRSAKDGKDMLDGGAGKDQLWGGGGADTFVFDDGDTALKASGRDAIMDFSHKEHDRIDLSDIDAIGKSAKDEAFKIYGTEKQALAHMGSLFIDVHGHDTTIYMNTDTKKGFDLAIDIDGVKSLVGSDFIL